MSAHTPGPWRAVRSGQVGRASAEFYIWHQVNGQGNSPAVAHVKHSMVQPTEANARLIAAAPDMLLALRRAVLALAFVAERFPAMRDDYEAVSAAIAKATESTS